MNNDHRDNHNSRNLPFSHGFNIGTTIQNVFRNINHAFASHRGSGSGQQRGSDARDRTNGDIPPSEPLNSVGRRRNFLATNTAHPSPSSAAPDPSISSTFPPADGDMPPHPHPQLDSQRDEDEDSMPELHSVIDSLDESDTGLPTLNSAPTHQDTLPVDEDRSSVWTDDEGGPPLVEPVTGTRRARVDDDGDDARDRRHPSERVGGPLPPGDAAPQNANPQQPPRPPPVGLFGALFGQGPPEGDAPHEHTHSGEGTADQLPAGNNPIPGHVPLGVPVFAAGFTLTIPIFGPPPGNRPGPAAGGQGGAPGIFNMDPASREELLASFAAFFQEFQGLDEAREDPERAKKLVAGLEVVPLGLVKRLEHVGGGHDGNSSAEGSSSGCAICWDTLLDPESDGFSDQQFPGSEVPQSSRTNTIHGQNETHTGSDSMDVDAPPIPASHSEPGTSGLIPPSLEAAKIISLPCAHVFHASCLLPWFTRAKQATCPSCRFNIDPENLTYTLPPRRVFQREPPQPDNAVPNPVPTDPHAVPEVPVEVPGIGIHAVNAVTPPIDPAHATADARGSGPPGPVPHPPTGQAGTPPAGPGLNPFVLIPGIPVMSFPAFQIPLRQAAAQAPGDGNHGTPFSLPPRVRAVPLPSSTNEYPLAPVGIDIMTVGLDMFVGGDLPEEQGGDHRDNAEGADNGRAGAGAGAGGENGTANPDGLAQGLHSLIEGLLRTTRNIIPQGMGAQGPAPAPAPAPAPNTAPAANVQPEPQVGPVPAAAGPQPGPPPAGGPRLFQFLPLHPNMLRPTRPMPPRRERKTWTLPPAPGLSLRQRVEQREREQGLRCSDTSCGIGPSDDDPYPELSASLTKQVSIHSLHSDGRGNDGQVSACVHAFHPACLVSAERVAGWGGEDKTERLVEVSCPVCRAVGCVTREEWESGVSAL